MTLMQWIVIKRIEVALGFKLHEWQKSYLLTGEFNPPGGRATGKTTIYCVKLVLSKDTFYRKYLGRLRDEDHGAFYPHWFRIKFLEIRDRLKAHGFKVCKIV